MHVYCVQNPLLAMHSELCTVVLKLKDMIKSTYNLTHFSALQFIYNSIPMAICNSGLICHIFQTVANRLTLVEVCQ